LEDQAIIALFWARSQQAITETADKYGKRLHQLSMNILHNHEDAQECINDTYHAAWNTLPPQKPDFFFAYIAKLARNFSFDKYDYNHAKKRTAMIVELSQELERCIPASNEPERTFENAEIGAALSAFLREQPKQMRRVFVQRYWYAQSIRAIAEDCGISESKVKSMLFRMRGKLKIHLEKEGITI
jgi:RNA polymerase sigma-70 factor (ECF subfamily)